MNKVILLGRIINELEPKVLQSGTTNLRFGLAVDRPKYQNQEGEPDVDFFNIIAWGKTAETIGKYFKKGNRILLEGKLRTNKYKDKNGKDVKTTDVWVDQIDFIERKEKTETASPMDSFAAPSENVFDQEIPF